MSRRQTLILVFISAFFFQNCEAPMHSVMGTLPSNGALNGFTLQVDQNLQAQALAILSSNCASCHDTAINGGLTGILDVNHLVAAGYVIPGNPTGSMLITSIQSGGMPMGGALAAADLTTLENWIGSMKLVGNGTPPPPPPPPPNPLPAGKTVQDDPTLHTQAMSILNINCAGCHQNDVNGGVTTILDVKYLVASGLVVAGDPTQGLLLSDIESGKMPAGTGARVTAADLQTLKNWIQSITIVNDTGQPPEYQRPPLDSSFTGIFTNIIQPKCYACHGPVGNSGGIRFTSYTAVSTDATNILDSVSGGGMPGSPYPRLTSAELSALQGWINLGKPNN
jgi:mono/diheme cytochrome c family protein